MSLAPCPPSSPRLHGPSYSRRTQTEIDTQYLREGLQNYYIQQQQKVKEKEEERKRQQKMAEKSQKQKEKGATILAAVNAGIIAVGPIPLDIGRVNHGLGGPPTPVPPLPSPVTLRRERK